MSSNRICPAVAAAKEQKGLSYSDIAQKIGKPEKDVVDMFNSGNAPNASTVKAVAQALDIQGDSPHDFRHGQ